MFDQLSVTRRIATPCAGFARVLENVAVSIPDENGAVPGVYQPISTVSPSRSAEGSSMFERFCGETRCQAAPAGAAAASETSSERTSIWTLLRVMRGLLDGGLV